MCPANRWISFHDASSQIKALQIPSRSASKASCTARLATIIIRTKERLKAS